jgi:hypothetical protein
MKEILYTPRGFTNSRNEYGTLNEEDMTYLVRQVIETLGAYAELTASSQGRMYVTNPDKEKCGKRGSKASIAPGRDNTRLSVLGGFVRNYFTKDNAFRNDISTSQMPYIESVLNECCDKFGFDAIVFRTKLFDFGK